MIHATWCAMLCSRIDVGFCQFFSYIIRHHVPRFYEYAFVLMSGASEGPWKCLHLFGLSDPRSYLKDMDPKRTKSEYQ